MLKIIATPKEFDDFWNNKILPSFNELDEEIDNLDLSDETKKHIQEILTKDINIVYDKLDEVYTNKLKYFARTSEENSIQDSFKKIEG